MTHPTRRTWLGTAAALASVAGLGGCGQAADKRLRFWAMGREGEVAPELLAGFRAEHPDIDLRIEALPWTAAHEKLLTAFAGDATPDVAQMGNTWLPEMSALGALAPLDTWQASSGLKAEDHYAGIWQANVMDGVLRGVPWYVDTRLLYYRSDLLQQAGYAQMPTNWADWTAAMTALQRLPRAAVAHPLLLPVNEFEPLLALALQQEGEVLKDGGRRGNFAGAGFQRALGFYMGLFAKGLAPDITNNQIANLYQEFGRSNFAFYISGPWNIGEFRRKLPPEMQGRWNTAPLPGPTGPGASNAGGSSLVMFQRSRHKPQAWALIEYLSRPAVQLQFFHLTGNLPPRRSTWALEPLASDPQVRAFANQLERARPTPAVPEWERIAQEMQLFAARAIHDRSTPLATGQALDVRVDEFLAKRRWMLDRATAAPKAST
jgi:multiple sugar transport system substrate-binding protein